MGIFDIFSGGSKPSGKRVGAAELREALLAINRDTAPWTVRDGGPEGVDLVAEWKIVDAAWYEIFAKAGIERVFKILMTFDEAAGQVRSVDHEFGVEWRAGQPALASLTDFTKAGGEIGGGAFRGQSWEISSETVWAFREEDLRWGKVYSYNFKTDEMKKPLAAAAKAVGWGWRAVAFGKV